MGAQRDKDALYDVLVEAAKAGYWPIGRGAPSAEALLG